MWVVVVLSRLSSLDGHGEHAVHDEDDEHVVPHHHVSVEVDGRPLRQEHVEGAAWEWEERN